LFEGIFALFDETIREYMDLKVFVHSDDDIRLLRRLKRDVIHRGRTVEGVIKSYNRFVKASYDEYIKPVIYPYIDRVCLDDEAFRYYTAKGI
jgi:uridine kinase